MVGTISTITADKGFYGWIALTGAALVYFTTAGTFYYSYGVFLPVICNQYGWSRAIVGGALSTALVVFGFSSPLIGASIARFGPKANIVFGSLLVVFGLAGMTITTEVWQLYLFYGILMGVGAALGTYMTCTAVVNNWFIRKRSLGMGLVISAGGLGGFAFPPLATWLISSFGMQIAWCAFAMIELVGAVLIGGLILVKNAPAEIGQLPDGISATHAHTIEKETSHTSRVYQSPVDWETGQAIRNPTIWLIAILCSVSTLALGTVTAHHVAYLMDMGFTPIVAAMTLGLIFAVSIVGRIGFGLLGVRFEVRHLAIFSSSLQVTALIILLTAKNLPFIYSYTVLFGISSGAFVVALPAFIASYYGLLNYTRILGFIVPIVLSAEAAGPVIAGVINDAFGSYKLAFAIIAGLSIVGLVCTIFAHPPNPQNRP